MHRIAVRPKFLHLKEISWLLLFNRIKKIFRFSKENHLLQYKYFFRLKILHGKEISIESRKYGRECGQDIYCLKIYQSTKPIEPFFP